MRIETRVQRYEKRKLKAEKLPISLATLSLHSDVNTALLIRLCACFGLDKFHVIGRLPNRSEIRNATGSTIDYVDIVTYQSQEEFLNFVYRENQQLIGLELSNNSIPIEEFKFSFDKPTIIFAGHEELGLPGVVANRCTSILEINLPGIGVCLNTTQAATIAVYEAVKQLKE